MVIRRSLSLGRVRVDMTAGTVQPKPRRSGTMLLYFLLGLIPLLGAIFILVYAIILLVWMCTDGHKEPNKWGPSPKYIPVNEINTGNNA